MAQNYVRLEDFESIILKGARKSNIIGTALARYCPLDEGHLATDLHSETAPDLGDLSDLPTEMQQHVLRFLDIESMLVFRRVNRRAMQLVNSLLEWNKVGLAFPSPASTCPQLTVKTERSQLTLRSPFAWQSACAHTLLSLSRNCLIRCVPKHAVSVTNSAHLLICGLSDVLVESVLFQEPGIIRQSGQVASADVFGVTSKEGVISEGCVVWMCRSLCQARSRTLWLCWISV
jgi:hypothetical protein